MSRQKNKNKKRVKGSQKNHEVVLTRRNQLLPPRVLTHLRFHVFGVINRAGFPNMSSRYVPTYAYDVDPSVGSTAMAGYAEFALLYRYYRVRKAKMTISFANNEAFNVLAWLSPFNFDPGNNVVSTTVQDYLANPSAKTIQLGPLTGRNTATLRCTATTASFGGVWANGVIDNYAGRSDGSAVPPNNWYFGFGLQSIPNLVNGVNAEIYIDIDVDWLELASPLA